MLYYIYYGYTIYKIYEYSHMIRFGYNAVYYTYSLTRGLYNILTTRKEDDSIDLEDWEYV